MEYKWYTILGIYTYTLIDYKEHKIDVIFKDIKTLKDVAQKKDFINKQINSVTACYVDVRENGIFYRDQQDCVVWSLDDKTGNVIANDEFIVAKNIPEFLTHMRDESNTWRQEHSR